MLKVGKKDKKKKKQYDWVNENKNQYKGSVIASVTFFKLIKQEFLSPFV